LTSSVKLKLIGLAVVTAAALLGYFIWMSASQSLNIDQRSRIPAPPEIAAIQFLSTDSTADRQPINDAQALFSSSNLSVEEADQATTFGLDSDNLPKIWVLQVGEASDTETANKMLVRLRNKGHKAFVQPTGKTAENRYFVYVGPKIDLLTIQRDKTTIDRQFAAISSTVVRYVR
tara:strand:+ start:262 stop:786 length:525 start_codon:yes stop_codon:yes gene_type:complete